MTTGLRAGLDRIYDRIHKINKKNMHPFRAPMSDRKMR